MHDEIVIIARFVAKEGQTEKLYAALSALLAPTRAESGCVSYDLHQGIDNARVLTMIEKFKNRAVAEFHARQPYLLAFIQASDELVESAAVELYKHAM